MKMNKEKILESVNDFLHNNLEDDDKVDIKIKLYGAKKVTVYDLELDNVSDSE